MDHWRHELADFDRHLAASSRNDYVSWQPTKWQSLETVRDLLIEQCWANSPGAGSALELGCGSATLLTQLRQRGIRSVGVDRDQGALALARRAAASIRTQPPEFVLGDFSDPAAMNTLGPADLVFHVGVIEHFEPLEQLDFLRLSARLSNRWVLVGIPNEHSPVFRSFLRSVTAENRVYDDDHQDIDVPALTAAAGYRVHIADGAHLFFGSTRFYIPGDPELDDFYGQMREVLITTGGERYSAFPHLDFTPADIPVLRKAEESVTAADRMTFGFLQYYLIDIG